MEYIKLLKSKKDILTRDPYQVGEYCHFSKCRFCYKENLIKIIDFGLVPLAGGFFPNNSNKNKLRNEQYYPLQIFYCSDCSLLQSTNIISPNIIFKKYYYYSSSMNTLIDHFKLFALDLKKILKGSKNRKVLEIGCNDGIFLKPLIKNGFNAIGIDPAENIIKPLKKAGFNVLNLYFSERNSKKIKRLYGDVDVISGTSSLAHIDDMHDILKGVKYLLKPDGIFIMEEHYLGSLLKETQYDMMYHEHPSYYSLLSLTYFLNMYNMHIFKVKYSTIRAGLMRYYIKIKDNKKYKIDNSVIKLYKSEKQQGFDKLSTYKKYYSKVNKSKQELLKTLNKIKKKGKSIVGYGASGRATIISSYCRLSNKYLDYIIDDAPQKQGVYTPYNHLKVHSSEILKDKYKRPDYALLFAWPFWKEIENKNHKYLKNGGKFIIPLPKVRIISK